MARGMTSDEVRKNHKSADGRNKDQVEVEDSSDFKAKERPIKHKMNGTKCCCFCSGELYMYSRLPLIGHFLEQI